MSQSHSLLYQHLVFSTKHRQPLLLEADRDRIHAYVGGVMRTMDSPTVAIGSIEDHIHILYRHSKRISVEDLLCELKSKTSEWMKSLGPAYAKFYWQSGYGVFSVSASQMDRTEAYVLDQRGRHKRRAFKEEYVGLLKKHKIEYDERYLWD